MGSRKPQEEVSGVRDECYKGQDSQCTEAGIIPYGTRWGMTWKTDMSKETRCVPVNARGDQEVGPVQKPRTFKLPRHC